MRCVLLVLAACACSRGEAIRAEGTMTPASSASEKTPAKKKHLRKPIGALTNADIDVIVASLGKEWKLEKAPSDELARTYRDGEDNAPGIRSEVRAYDLSAFAGPRAAFVHKPKYTLAAQFLRGTFGNAALARKVIDGIENPKTDPSDPLPAGPSVYDFGQNAAKALPGFEAPSYAPRTLTFFAVTENHTSISTKDEKTLCVILYLDTSNTLDDPGLVVLADGTRLLAIGTRWGSKDEVAKRTQRIRRAFEENELGPEAE